MTLGGPQRQKSVSLIAEVLNSSKENKNKNINKNELHIDVISTN